MRLSTFGGLRLEGGSARVQGLGRRPLALLARLAVAGEAGVPRDALLALLWPESSNDRARHALAQLTYRIRTALGADAVRVTADQRLVGTLAADVRDFRAAVRAGDDVAAIAIATGPFLDGVHVDDAPAFERWADDERAALTGELARAITRLVDAAVHAGRVADAAALQRRLVTLDPFAPRPAQRCVELIAAAGDAAGALAFGRAWLATVAAELEAAPDPAMVATLERIVATPVAPHVARMVDAVHVVADGDTPLPQHAPTDALAAPHTCTPDGAAPDGDTRAARTPAMRADAARGRTAWRLHPRTAVAALVLLACGALIGRTGGGAGLVRDLAWRSAAIEDSIVAQRSVREGRMALAAFEPRLASRRLGTAARAHPASALVTYYAWRAAVAAGDPAQWTLAARAESLAAAAPERDRLLVRTHVATAREQLAAIALGRELAARFPSDPEALVRAATPEHDLPAAVALLERAIALDSAAARVRDDDACWRCEALDQLVLRLWHADSLEAAMRTARRWTAMRPEDGRPWYLLRELRLAAGRPAAADSAGGRYVALGGDDERGALRVAALLRSDDVAGAGARCAVLLAATDDAVVAGASDWCALVLREQGRLDEARALATDGTLPGVPSGATRRLPTDPVLLAALELEAGAGRAAATRWETLARQAAQHPVPGKRARDAAWFLTLATVARLESGDTTQARRLADSIEVLGARSFHPRDPRLHHAVRGLLLTREGRAEAAVRELRRSIHSPTFGLTRVNLVLGRLLVGLGRADEAVPVLRAALRGGIEGGNLYVSRRALHAALADAFVAAGRPDSARAHAAIVARMVTAPHWHALPLTASAR